MIVEDKGYEPGMLGFLVNHWTIDSETREVWAVPVHSDSGRPCLVGWARRTNGVDVHACGVVRVTSVTLTGRARARIRLIRSGSAEERSALKRLGYPQLLSRG